MSTSTDGTGITGDIGGGSSAHFVDPREVRFITSVRETHQAGRSRTRPRGSPLSRDESPTSFLNSVKDIPSLWETPVPTSKLHYFRHYRPHPHPQRPLERSGSDKTQKHEVSRQDPNEEVSETKGKRRKKEKERKREKKTHLRLLKV